MELLDPSGTSRGEILRFAHVLVEIVKLKAAILIPLDEFPITLSHCPRGRAALVSIVGIMPKERPSLQLTALKQRRQTDSIEMLLLLSRQAGQFQQGGIKIGAHYRRGAKAARPGDAGRSNNPGLPDATFVKPAFAGAQGNVGGDVSFGGREAAVVGHEDHDGAIAQVKLFDRIEHATNRGVQLFQHRRIDRIVLNKTHLAGMFLAPGIGRGRSLLVP